MTSWILRSLVLPGRHAIPARVNDLFTNANDASFATIGCGRAMYAPLLAALGLPMMIGLSTILMAARNQPPGTHSSQHRFKRLVRQNHEAEIRLKAKRSFEQSIAVIPRFTGMHR